MYTGSKIAEMSQLATQYKWYVYNFSHYTGWYVHIICVQCSIQNSKHIAASSKPGSVQTLASQHYDCLPSNKQFGYVKTSAVMASQTTVFQKCLGNHLLVVKVMERGLQNLVFNLSLIWSTIYIGAKPHPQCGTHNRKTSQVAALQPLSLDSTQLPVL